MTNIMDKYSLNELAHLMGVCFKSNRSTFELELELLLLLLL